MNNSYNSRTVGILFILVMITWGIGFGLIESIISGESLFENVIANKIKLQFGVLFELIEMVAIVGIVSILYPFLEKVKKGYAVGYLGFRLIESVLLLIAVICALLLIPLSNSAVLEATTKNANYQSIASILIELRNNTVHTILPVFYSSAAIILNYFLYKTKYVPRLLSIWGGISAVLVLLQVPLGFVDFKALEYAGISMGLNELVLGFWLIIKGFDVNTLKEKMS